MRNVRVEDGSLRGRGVQPRPRGGRAVRRRVPRGRHVAGHGRVIGLAPQTPITVRRFPRRRGRRARTGRARGRGRHPRAGRGGRRGEQHLQRRLLGLVRLPTLVRAMKTEIHPEYTVSNVRCTCGNEFTTRSTKGDIHVEICSNCHPFYTGKQKLVDTGGRVERFQRKLARSRGGENSPRCLKLARRAADHYVSEQPGAARCPCGRPGRPRRRDDARRVHLGGGHPQAAKSPSSPTPSSPGPVAARCCAGR